MRALTVIPERKGSAAVTDVEEPEAEQGDVLVDGLALGVCGTDREIIAGEYGRAPAGHERLVLGHESLGIVKEAPTGGDFAAGDLVVGIVRRPDPIPCEACARGEFDMCRNGLFKERGINQLDGYGSQRWRVESDYCVKLDPGLRSVGMLIEPTTVVAKAIEQIRRIGEAMQFEPQRMLVTGAGPIGLLGAMLGVQHGLEVHVLDQVADGPKPQLVADLGATYHCGDIADAMGEARADAILEATGVGKLVFDAMDHLAPGGIVCLTGLSPAGGTLTVEAGSINRDLVLQNNVVLGSVNANRRHYQAAAEALAAADRSWLERLITRRVPLESYEEALETRVDDVKVVLEIGGAAQESRAPH
jgi:glucose 1-dehydrogenase